MDVTAAQAVNQYLLHERRNSPPEALVESIKDSVKQQDRTLGNDGARMVASQIAARYIDVKV